MTIEYYELAREIANKLEKPGHDNLSEEIILSIESGCTATEILFSFYPFCLLFLSLI